MFRASSKIKITAAILFSCCMPCGVYADKIDLIRNTASNNFPATFHVSENQFAQLSWVLDHKNRTYDMDFAAADDTAVHIEIHRALTRLYCAQLLRTGTVDAYNSFIAAQLEADVAQPLQLSSFMQLSRHIQHLTDADYELVEAAIILTSVSLTQSAANLAQRVINVDSNETDALDFLSYTLRDPQDLYPITWNILNKNSNSKRLFYVLFPPHTNFRHMLYTEGGIGMFNYLRSMIAHGYINHGDLNLWYAFWIVNISGFRGHVQHNGSLYLTDPVAEAMGKLKYFVYEMLENPTYDPLLPYLEYRAKCVGYDRLPRDERLFFAHLACLLRIYTITEGQRLYASVTKLPLSERYAVMQEFYKGLHNTTHVYATHVPALFGNALHIEKGNIEKVILKILPAYNKILLQYRSENTESTLCCNELSAMKNLELLLQS
jgi:hypothetical protein